MVPNVIKFQQQMDELLKEIKELKENQKVMNEKMTKMQQVIDHIESDIYLDEFCDCEDDCDFEIVCPYCEYEFLINPEEHKYEVECPECKNVIELDWTGDFDEEDKCPGHCHGCSGCEDSDEDEDM